MTNYSLKNVFDRLDKNDYDYIFMDSGYRDNKENNVFLKDKNNILYGNFSFVRDSLLEYVKNDSTLNYLYVVTGSPLFYSGSGVIIKHLSTHLDNFSADKDLIIIDACSSLSYVLRKKGIDSSKVETLSMHGRTKIDLGGMFRKRYTFVLCDKYSLSRINDAFRYLNPENYSIMVGSRLGYNDESVFNVNNLEAFLNTTDVEKLMPYVLLIERYFTPSSGITDDDEFLRDRGMITKSFKRGLTLAELDLSSNMLMWDVGAGSGSISIDAYKQYKVRSVMFEKNEKRASDIEQNLTKHNIIASNVVVGDVMETSKELTEKPDRIFVGGGGVNVAQNIMYFVDKLADGGLMLINYVTLDYIHFVVGQLRDNNIRFDVKSLSLTTFKDRNILISEPERLMFQIKIYK